MKLLEPITVRGMTLKNRIVMSSMGVALGYSNKRMRNFYVERARGGVGAMIIGGAIPELFASDEIWGKAGAVESFLERVKSITDEIHVEGAKIGIQFYYGNRYPFSLNPQVANTGDLVAPSARVEPDPARSAWTNPGDRLRQITEKEIDYIIQTIGKAAAGAKTAGFDFVELHGAHGLIPCQFISPVTNQRTDKYGGDLRKRMQFGIECIQSMRAAVGDNYPISIRVGGMDKVPNGYGLDEGIAYAMELEKAGVDILNVSIGMPPFKGGYVPAGEDPIGTHVQLAETIKRHVKIPVIACGRVKTPEFAESILAQGKIDMIAVGRQLIADPYWPQKAAEGRTSDIVPCIDCHSCYDRTVTYGEGVECSVNYCAGREGDSAIIAAEKPKKVLIVGGGPAGMEAARVAAIRGHNVTITEKSNQLGGAMLLQAVIPYKDELENFTKYLSEQITAKGVKIETGQEATPETIQSFKPDVVIFATGATPATFELPTTKKEKVINSGDIQKLMTGGFKNDEQAIRSGWRGTLIRSGSKILNRSMPLSFRKKLAGAGIPVMFGKHVAIIGSDFKAAQLADLLAENGRKVSVIAKEQILAEQFVPTLRLRLMKRLAERGVSIMTGVMEYQEITDSGLVIINQKGEKEIVTADTVVPIVDPKKNDDPIQKFKDLAPEVYAVGDFVEQRKLLNAVHEGSRIARML